MKCDLTGIKGWVFDVDDTIYLERDYVKSGFHAVGDYIETATGNAYFGEICWSLFESGVRGDVFNRALSELQISSPVASVSKLVDVYRLHNPSISCQQSIIEALRKLGDCYEISIITGGPEASQRRKVSALGLDTLSNRVVYSGIYGPSLDKPHPWSWKEIENRTGLHGNDLIYVGDNPSKDFDAPLELGWRTLRVRQKNSLHEALPTPSGVPECRFLIEGITSMMGDLS